MKKLLGTIALLSLLSACKGTDGSDTALMVSIEPQRWILEQLVDSGTVVGTMLERGADPETFSPSLADRSAAAACRIYFSTGALPFEEALRESSDVRFVDTSEGIGRVYGTHTHHHHDGDTHAGEDEGDPHVWTSVSGARAMAANMARALSDDRPDKADEYGRRLARLNVRFDSIDSAIAARLAGSGAHSFAIWHPSLSYFARDYGLHQLAIGQESKEMSARMLREAIDRAVADSVRVFFIQKEYDSRQARTINDEIGSRLVTIDPLDYNWDKQILNIADELARP